MAFGVGRAIKKKLKPRKNIDFEYVADNVGVRNKNLSFMSEKKFSDAWEKAVEANKPAWGGRTQDIRWRAHTAVWAARHGLALEGDFVECGVFLGYLSITICHCLGFEEIPKKFYLFDTFEGIPDDGREQTRNQNKPYFDCYEIAERNFSDFQNVVLVKGKLPETLSLVDMHKIAYLSMDLNHAVYEREVIEELWCKVESSAVILIDDYAFHRHEEQYEMWNEFAGSKGCSILTMPTGAGVLIKP